MNQFKELQSIKEKLANHITTQHKFTDQSKSLCAPDTRVEIQRDILEWLSPQPGTNERIFWITGIAGSGKSTLSATLVDNLRKEHTPVAAQFFISRNIPETTNPDKIIPTIAQQLAESSPAAAHIIHDKLKYGFPSSRKEQVEELLLAPIRELSKSGNAVIILIDALDELGNAADSVKEILESIAPRGCDLPDNVRFLITSRPEHWAVISSWVNIVGDRTLELAVFEQHALDTESSVNEVHKFIIARMKEITPRDWDGWPTQDQLLQLSTKADGLFHYAATALQWIQQQIRRKGTVSRNQVFEKFAQQGIGQLNDLYKLIVTSFDDPTEDTDWRARQVRTFRHVFGMILVLYKPLTIRQIIALLADIPEDDFDVKNFLQQMCSVLIPGTTTLFEEAIPQIHKSFRDYIMDGSAPEAFRILMGHAHFVTARSCLEVIVKAGSQADVVVEYSVQHWYKHFQKAIEGGVTCEDERMWNLFGEILEEAVIGIWVRTHLKDLFVNVAAAGWELLKVRSKYEGEREKSDNLAATGQ
jgi:nucleoside-triphosphatase THEP1